MTLSERHQHELEASGIPPEVIAERGYRTVTDPAELRRLGFADWQALPGLLIPLHDLQGGNGRYKLKPDRPRIDRKPDKPDRVVKYESQAGQPPALDVPLRCLAGLQDPTVRLVFTEGEKKADKAAAAGMCAVSIPGVWGWVEKGRVPLKDFEPLIPYLNGREVVLAFDSDPAPKTVENVNYALRCLTNFLREHGAWVSWAILPAAPGQKVGLDDYLLEHDVADFETTIQAPPDVRSLQRENRELKQLLSAQAAVLRNAGLTPTQKVVAIATVHEAGWRESQGGPAPYRVNTSRLAEAAGVSPQTVSSSLKILSEPSAIFAKTVTREIADTDQGPQWRSVMKLTPRHTGGVVGLLKATAAYAPTDRPTWGGKRTPHCPDHPTADIAKRSTLACVECGQVIGEPVVTILKCQDDNSGLEEFDDPITAAAETLALPLQSQDDISEIDSPSTTSVPPPLRTTDDQVDISEPLTLEIVVPPPPPASRPEPTGQCPGCGESWSPRDGSTAELCGVCTYYAAQRARMVVSA